MVGRRKFVVWGAAVLAAPPAALAQQKVHRIGFLGARSRSDLYYNAFVQGMRELGYVEGKNLEIEWRLVGGDYTKLAAHAAELVRLKPEVVVAHGTSSALAMQKATRDIPVVFISVNDPVASGLVASLARPGANITGASNMISDLSKKQVELMKIALPRLRRAAVLINPSNESNAQIQAEVEHALQGFGIKPLIAAARTPAEIESAIARLGKEKVDALFITTDGFLLGQSKRIAELALQARIASIYGIRDYALSGGLIGYGPNLAEVYRRGAFYVDRVFKGVSPADMAIEQPRQLELYINLKTAEALRLKIPQDLLQRADQVIR